MEQEKANTPFVETNESVYNIQQLLNKEETPEYDPRSPMDRDIPLAEWKKQQDIETPSMTPYKDMNVVKKEQENKKIIGKSSSIYNNNILNERIVVDINDIGNNLDKIIEQKIKMKFEGKCVKEGFIKSGSVKIVTYSSGEVSGNKIIFQVAFSCMVCNPVEGMTLRNCVVKNNTKAGLKAETREEVSPVVIFVSRDHHYSNKEFSEVNEGDSITVRVIGTRFELNDKYISIIAQFLEKYQAPKKIKIRPKNNN